ncbi:MAG: RagB/SusD family nutrient uptake outer membrane protein [Muribaculaceae bacterium]|nr:RagB/SusD family nutrient uptake outer membrane protein [Muribaculaceae bacterium]
MKKIYLFLMSAALLAGFSSCNDELETAPTDAISASIVFDDAKNAEAAVEGIYRILHTPGWSANWASENIGHIGNILVADIMAEDHPMAAQGQGWFWEDYKLNVHADYSHTSGRSYALWNFYYTIISNANYIAGSQIGGSESLANEIYGQAYALRAFCYFYLAQFYAKCPDKFGSYPGVPYYDEPTVAGAEGKSRGTVSEIYGHMRDDIDKAIEYLAIDKHQTNVTHIDYYAAQGLKARIALVQRDYDAAIEAASEAMKKPGCGVLEVADFTPMSKAASNWLWGAIIQVPDQASNYMSYLSHMDPDYTGHYAEKANQCISSGLYKMMTSKDKRRSAWWEGAMSTRKYCQKKYKGTADDYANSGTGDICFMRYEEMILIKAEAECAKKNFAAAKATIAELMDKRKEDWKDDVAKVTDSDMINPDTNLAPSTLMEYILLQRRLELWSEVGRIFDLNRLHLGYNRKYSGSNHPMTLEEKNTDAESDLFILPLPQREIDGNENITAEDNNPIVQ